MNNFQNTNFNYDQFGSGTWRYSVMSHAGSWNDGTVTQFGWDLSSPLLVRFYESESDGYLPNALSLVQLDADNVKILALRPAENDDGFIVRLFENCGLDSQVEMKIPILENIQASVVDLAEHELSPLIFEGDAAIIDIGAFELLTLKFDGDCAYSPGDDVDDDNDTEEDDDIDDSGCCG